LIIQRKRVAKRLASGLLAGALALGGLAISGGSVSAKTPTSPTTNRLAGDDRYETAVELARDLNNVDDGLVVVSGESPWDALSAAPLTTNKRPMLLVRQNSVPETVLDFVSDYKSNWLAGNDKIYIVGGTAAISAEVEAAIVAAATTAGDTGAPKAVRLAGESRYGTSKAVAASALVSGAGDKAILVNGNSWADAVSAGAMSAENGWPIILTPGSASGDAKAAIDAYIDMPGSTAEFIIVGGPAVMPSSIDEYLVGEGVAPEDIDRIGGADRYQTSLLVNVYLYNYDSDFSGTNIALVSGESPWDALAAAGWAANKAASPDTVHVQLTPSAGGNVYVSTLAGTLSSLASANAGLVGRNGTLYVIGGKSAVSDAAKVGYSAAAATDISTALVCPAEGAKGLVIAYTGALSAAEQARATAAAIAPKIKKNGTALATPADVAAVTKLTSSTYFVTLTAAVAEDDEFKLAADVEGSNYTVLARSAAGSSCTVVDDSTDPVVSMRAVAGPFADPAAGAAQHLILTSSEPLNIGATLAIGKVSMNGVLNGTAAPATKLNTAGTAWLITIDPADATINAALAAGKVAKVSADALPDLAGNTPDVDVSATAADDSSAAVLSVAGVTCIQGAGFAKMSKGDLDVTAKATSTLGAAGNLYSLAVVNQRGLLVPTVSVNADTKVITVTADTGYHTPQDVTTAARNSLVEDALLGNWVFTDNGGVAGLVATTTNALSTAGSSDCTIEVTSNEPMGVTSASVTVGGFAAVVTAGPTITGAGAVTGTSDAKALSFDIDITTTLLGDGAISFTGAKNTSLVTTAAGLTFTAS